MPGLMEIAHDTRGYALSVCPLGPVVLWHSVLLWVIKGDIRALHRDQGHVMIRGAESVHQPSSEDEEIAATRRDRVDGRPIKRLGILIGPVEESPPFEHDDEPIGVLVDMHREIVGVFEPAELGDR